MFFTEKKRKRKREKEKEKERMGEKKRQEGRGKKRKYKVFFVGKLSLYIKIIRCETYLLNHFLL